MSSYFTFASPWALTPLGRENLLQTFTSNQANSSVEILSSGDREECISLRCSEECFLSFVKHVSAFCKAELEAQHDVFDIPELRRLDGTSAISAISPTKKDQIQHKSQENVLFIHENRYEYWRPSGKGGFYLLPTILGKIEIISSVRIENLQGKFIVRGDTDEAIANAIRKLNVIEEALAHQTITRDYLILEGALSPKLRIVSLKEGPDSRLKTTLLSPRSPLYQTLASCRIVYMSTNGTGVVHNINSSVRNDSTTYLWQGHNLSTRFSYQDQEILDATMRRGDATADTPIENWIAKSTAALVIDPFVPSNDDLALLAHYNEDPFLPPPSWTSSDQKYASPSWDDHIVLPKKATDILIEIGESSESSQVHGIQKHETMKQRKPQIAIGDSIYLKMHAVQQDVTDFLGSAISRPSSELRINIGRILVDQSSIPHDFRKGDFEAKEWGNAAANIRTIFTEMLTTNSSDLNNILDLKLKHGRPLFNKLPSHRNVIYVIKGQTKSHESVVIEIDENQRFKIRGSRFIHGTINWHFVKRAWDAQLVLSSDDFIRGDYIREIQSLVESLAITLSPCGNWLDFSFHSKGSDFEFHETFLRRETVHNSYMYPDLLLHLTEVQDLRLSRNQEDGRDQENLDRYLGTSRVQNEMINSHRLWWELSLSSQRVSDILKENASLELGEKAKWKPERIIETGAVADLQALAQEIVTRIDYVGKDNKGHAMSSSKNTTQLSSHELPTGPQGFW